MLNWLKKLHRDDSKYRKILLDAFPITLRKDVEIVLDILPFDVNEIKLSDGQTYKTENFIHPHLQTVQLDGEILTIPYRINLNEPEPDKELKLTSRQKTILNCIYLRHHNGYVRQRRLEKIESDEYWITTFTFPLLGEYIFEILEVLSKQLDDKKLKNYQLFAIENPQYFQKTECRMVSYWNEYYRWKFPNFRLYMGRIIFDQIKKKPVGLNR